jgi:uncharacterized protein
MAADRQAWRRTDAGLLLDVRATPKSSRDAVTGWHDDGERLRLAVAVRAVPDKGAANAAVVAAVARWLELTKSAVTLASGNTSRLKTLAVAGPPDALTAILTEKIAAFDLPETVP